MSEHQPTDLTVYRNEKAANSIDEAIRLVREAHGACNGGLAIVLWDANGASTAHVQCLPGSPLPSTLVPEFVKLRLLGEVVEGWAIKAALQVMGSE